MPPASLHSCMQLDTVAVLCWLLTPRSFSYCCRPLAAPPVRACHLTSIALTPDLLQGLVEGGAADRPAWLNMAVHVVNSLVAWLDLLIGKLLMGCSLVLIGGRRAGCKARRAAVLFSGWRPRLQKPLGCRTHTAAETVTPVCRNHSVALALKAPSPLCPTRAVEERSFKGSSRHLALLFAVAYCTWLLVVRQRFGKVGSHMLF